MSKNKIGRFSISATLLREWERFIPMFGNFAIIDARLHWDTQSVEYLAYSELFDEVDQSQAAPTYEITIDNNTFPVTVRAIKRA